MSIIDGIKIISDEEAEELRKRLIEHNRILIKDKSKKIKKTLTLDQINEEIAAYRMGV